MNRQCRQLKWVLKKSEEQIVRGLKLAKDDKKTKGLYGAAKAAPLQKTLKAAYFSSL